MFVKTQYERIVNLTHYSVIKIDYSISIHGRSYHRIWVETTDGDNRQVLAEWRADINKPISELGAKHATKTFDAIFENLLAGEKAFDLKTFIEEHADNIPF